MLTRNQLKELTPERLDTLFKAAQPKLTPYIPQQPTPKQSLFLMLPHKEAFYGGSAGGGKSSCLLMAALQYVDQPDYAALILRRTFSDLNKPGAIMDRAKQWLIGQPGVHWNATEKRFTFPSGATLSFGYLENANDHFQYQGAEFQFIGFDELTQFPENQYLYLYSRLRKNKGNPVPLRMRSAGNPGGRGHEWVKQRFIVEGLKANKPRAFVPAKLIDNPYLDQEEYLESLMELDPVTREQLLNGDWDAALQGGMFKRFWFKAVDRSVIPWDRLKLCRYWDLAASEPSEEYKDPDWTVGMLVGFDEREGKFYILDVVRDRLTPLGVERLVQQTAKRDGKQVHILMEREGGASGKTVIANYRTKVLQGYTFREHKPETDKIERANPVSARAEAGDYCIVSDVWTTEFLNEVAVFPSKFSHDDQVDTLTGSYEYLTGKKTGKGSRRTVAKESVESFMIGDVVTTSTATSLYASRPNIDFKKTDYRFYDRLRRNKAENYELGGALADRACRIMQQFTFGKGVTLTVEGLSKRQTDAINRALANFIETHDRTLSEWQYDGITLGDGYIVVNPDGSLRQVSPEQVKLEHDLIDYRRLDRATIQTNILYDTSSATISDTYTPVERVVRTRVGTEEEVTTTFPNLIGQIPLLHFPYGRSSNEIYGHSAMEGLLYNFARYNNVMQKSLDGVERMGNPIPVATGLEDPGQERDDNATGEMQTTDANGDPETVKVMDFSEVNMLWLSGDFKFASPAPFTADAAGMLQLLFYLMAERTGIIEGVWGTAMNSSHASLDAQMPAFDITIMGWQLDFTPYLKQAAKVWLAWQGLTNPNLRLPDGVDIKVTWGRWLQPDATLLFQKTQYAEGANLLRNETALRGLELPFVKDPAEEVKQAEKEAEARNPFGETEANINRLANREDGPPNLDEQQGRP